MLETPTHRRGDWDFSAALNLINSGQDETTTNSTDSAWSSPPSLTPSEFSDKPWEPNEQPQVSLGNFDRLWQFLGTSAPTSSFADLIAHEKETGSQLRLGKEPKSVTWSDERPDVTGLHSITSDLAALNGSPLTKTQRKKLRRRIRKANDLGEQTSADEESTTDLTTRSMTFSKHARPLSEGEADDDAKLAVKRSKDRQNIIQQIIAETPVKAKKQQIKNPHDFFLHQVAAKQPSPQAPEPRYNLRSQDGRTSSIVASTSQTSTLTDAFNKKNDLIQLLFKHFQADCATLAGISYTYDTPYSSSQNPNPGGIHVFVDISNILIGLHDAIKIKKGLSRSARLPRQKLSFYNFSLVLERGRPAAKRCLAGSDMLECIDEARQIGYETNILERVTKEKALTPRQRYFKARDRSERSGASSGGEAQSGPGSGTEEEIQTVTKRVEQAVDEILHLNMMLSIVDTAEPSTIVLATGDAAEAEYSEGFLSMCERALSKGWKVEVVAFKHNMSFAYRRKDWIARWSGRFTVIELDDYVEQLRL